MHGPRPSVSSVENSNPDVPYAGTGLTTLMPSSATKNSVKESRMSSSIRNVLLLSLLFSLLSIAFGQGGSVTRQVIAPTTTQYGTGQPASYALIRVCTSTAVGTPCSPLVANVYADQTLTTPLPAAFAADVNGIYNFFAPTGEYLIQESNAIGAGYTFVYSYLTFLNGTGTVSSVDLSLPSSVFLVSGNPITGAGTLTGAFISQSANKVFANCTGSSAVPTFCSIIANMLPATLNASTIDGLTVIGPATISTTLGVTGATTLSSTLAVSGTSTLSGGGALTGTFTGTPTLSGNLTFSGNPTFTGSPVFSTGIPAFSNGAALYGSFSGNPTFTGTPTVDGTLYVATVTGLSIGLVLDVAQNFNVVSNGGPATIISGPGGATSGNSGNINLNAGAVVSGTLGTIQTNTIIGQYNGITTADIGASIPYAASDLSGLTTTTGPTTLLVGNSTTGGHWRLCYAEEVTTSDSSGKTITFSAGFTSHTVIHTYTGSAVAVAATNSERDCVALNVDSVSNVTYTVTSSGSFSGANYAVDVWLVRE